MTETGNDALRKLALRALAQHAGPAPAADAVAAAARRAYDDLARASASLLGEVGVDALTSRALHLAQQKHPWLVEARAPGQMEAPIVQAIAGLERQTPDAATEAAGAVFATLTGLLATFIGEQLTVGLLRKAWPDAFSDPDTEET